MHSFAMLMLECITEKVPFSDLPRGVVVIHLRSNQQETVSASTRWTGSEEAVPWMVYGSRNGSVTPWEVGALISRTPVQRRGHRSGQCIRVLAIGGVKVCGQIILFSVSSKCRGH